MTPAIRVPAASAPRVSFVIPSAADESLLAACLGSLERHVPSSIPAETIVVLDGAPEDASARVAALAPGAVVVASPVRLGLARAANRGRALAKGEFVVVLHDDAEIDAGWPEAMLAAAAEHPSAGAFAGFIAFPDGRPQTAGVTLFRDGAALPPWGSALGLYDFAAPRAVDFCPSNALFVRAAAWDDAGGMDPRFFPAYFVDADFAMALGDAGWSCRYVPAARSRHRRGASSRRDFAEWVSGRNRGLFVEKWARELEAFEAWDGGTKESFEKALRRAEARASRLREDPSVRRENRPLKVEEGISDLERRALEQDLALQRAWAKTLVVRLEAFEGLLWWRLYVRLLPILRPLRRLVPAFFFSRRGSSSRTE